MREKKILTAGCLFSEACLRQDVIPLTHPLHAFPLKLAASVVKRDRDAPDVDLPVSEKDCQPKLKSELRRDHSTAVRPNGK